MHTATGLNELKSLSNKRISSTNQHAADLVAEFSSDELEQSAEPPMPPPPSLFGAPGKISAAEDAYKPKRAGRRRGNIVEKQKSQKTKHTHVHALGDAVLSDIKFVHGGEEHAAGSRGKMARGVRRLSNGCAGFKGAAPSRSSPSRTSPSRGQQQPCADAEAAASTGAAPAKPKSSRRLHNELFATRLLHVPSREEAAQQREDEQRRTRSSPRNDAIEVMNRRVSAADGSLAAAAAAAARAEVAQMEAKLEAQEHKGAHHARPQRQSSTRNAAHIPTHKRLGHAASDNSLDLRHG
jgi:hypothetical protein